MAPARTFSFDQQRHITARQLRALGFYVREDVPGNAYVQREAVGLRDEEDLDDGTATLGLNVLERFRTARRELMQV